MKKTLSILLALSMILSLGAAAFASDPITGDGSSEKTTDAEVILEVPDNEGADYEVTIAPDMNLSRSTGEGTHAAGSFELALDPKAILSPGKTNVRVTLKQAANDNTDGKHYLKDVNNINKPLNYSIQKDETDVILGDYNSDKATVLLDAVAGADEIKAMLDIALISTITQSGTFKDVLTFSIGEIALEPVKDN